MGFRTRVLDKKKEARYLSSRLDQIQLRCAEAKAGLGTDYFQATTLPAVLYRFKKEMNARPAGYLDAVGPVLATYLGGDTWPNEKANFAQLLADIVTLADWLRSNSALFILSIGNMANNGRQFYNTPIDASKESELLGLLDAVLSKFE